jgi:hypothetical protein
MMYSWIGIPLFWYDSVGSMLTVACSRGRSEWLPTWRRGKGPTGGNNDLIRMVYQFFKTSVMSSDTALYPHEHKNLQRIPDEQTK